MSFRSAKSFIFVAEDAKASVLEGLEGGDGSTGFDYSNLTFSDAYDGYEDSSEFSFDTPAPIDSIRKKALQKAERELQRKLNERRELFKAGTSSESSQLSDDEQDVPFEVAHLKKMNAILSQKEFGVNNLVEMTYKSFTLNEDILNNNLEGDENQNVGVSEDDDTD